MMARYHINSRGESGLCTAQVGNCPFGGSSEHYPTAEEARSAYESKRLAETIPTIRRGTFDFGNLMNLVAAPTAEDLDGLDYFDTANTDSSVRGLVRSNFFSNDPNANSDRVEEKAYHVAKLLETALSDRFGGKWSVPLGGGHPVQVSGSKRLREQDFLQLQDEIIDNMLFARA